MHRRDCTFTGKKKDGSNTLKKEAKLVFDLVIHEPGTSYHGVRLEMWAPWSDSWRRRPPRRSKLYTLIRIACGGLGHGQRVSKAIFINKLFRVKLKQVLQKESGHVYSVAETIVEKIAG
jgi:hypothetical protein